ncbi:MAG: serine/threonine protein kinase [Phenylobacterium sp.]|uniref:serine/threonine-protein kinase n=1 Tax=Phenylobacterium sp. TaxID=1871053 RepID=UPI001207C4FC|nr:serine/threonine-protein kinase [Phenylobacterium sp.]TAL33568.1 MAG: serine/threonine protein kinase [Phenylobacterium sp.]
MPPPRPEQAHPEQERQALALFERLSDRPDDARYRKRLLARIEPAVVQRVEALERSAAGAGRAMPTEFPAVRKPLGPPPEQVGPFRLVEQIGEGGMGQVWRGERSDGLFDQTVAVKLLWSHLAPLAARRFAEERRILARLEHPNIARLIDGGVLPDGTPWLAMEHVAGRPIDEACAGRPLREAVAVFVQAAEAVQFAHAQLIVHADLKPSNILVGADGRVRLLDFGIARLLGEEVEGLSPMTPDFASPERIAGAAPVVADDVFALGLVLEGLAGKSADADLLAIVAKARAHEAVDRYGSVADLIADLIRWRDGFGVQARAGDGALYRARRFVGRHRWGVGLVTATILALSAATTISTVSYIRAEQARAEARARFEQARGAARYLLFDLGDRLERQPRSLKLRIEAARVSQAYLDRLARSPDAPLEVKAESVRGLLRLAEVQGRPGRPNLGQTDQAKKNLATAYALAAAIPGETGRRLRARARLDQAHITVMIDNDFPATERYLAEARALIFDPARPIVELQRDWHAEMGALRVWQGRYAEAMATARAGLSAPPPRDARTAVIIETALQDLIAESTYYAEGAKPAVAPYRVEMALLEEAARRWPDDPTVRRLLPRARWALGTTLIDAGQAEEAARILQRGVAEARAVVAFEPADVDSARALDMTQSAYAQALSATGRVGEAVPILAGAAEARRRRMEARPEVVMYARDYAVALAALGDVQAPAGRVADACRNYDAAGAVFADLQRTGRYAALDDSGSLKLLREAQARWCGARNADATRR